MVARLEGETAEQWFRREQAENAAKRPRGMIGGERVGGSAEAHTAMMAEQAAARRQTQAEQAAAKEQARVKTGRPKGAFQSSS